MYKEKITNKQINVRFYLSLIREYLHINEHQKGQSVTSACL